MKLSEDFTQTPPSWLREDEVRTKRWEHLTEGIEDEVRLRMTETLLDNTALMTQGRLNGFQMKADETTTTADIAVFTRNVYPLIRRIYPEMISNELVSFQPMTMPTMRLFGIDFKTGTDLSPTQAGDHLGYGTDVHGNNPAKHNMWYTSGKAWGESLGTGTGSRTVFNTRWFPLAEDPTVYVNSVETTAYTIDLETGRIEFSVAPVAGASVTIDYSLQMEGLGSRGNARIADVTLGMSSWDVSSESKKIKAKWTLEMEQDFYAYHGLRAEAELTEEMEWKVKFELDRMIVSDLYRVASAGNVNWSKAIPAGVKLKDHYETLIHAIEDASHEIYIRRLRHANFVIVPPNVWNMLIKLDTYRAINTNKDGGAPTFDLAKGPNMMGTLEGKYRVIVDPLAPSNKILVGYKGSNWKETGYIFAPYVALGLKTFVNPETMEPVKSLMNRFGRHVISGDFYATVTITN